MRNERVDDILDQCIERMASGESVSSCLASYPEHREELEPLLRVASATMRAVATHPSPGAKARGLMRLNDASAERAHRKRSLFGWLPAWPTLAAKPLVAATVVALVVSGLAFGADRAAANSVPGEPLYWIKMGRENLSLMMPKSDAARAHEHARLAKVRSDEMGRLVQMGNLPEAQKHSVTISIHLDQSAQLVGITMSTNPIEMPARVSGTAPDNDVERLKLLLASDWQYTESMLDSQMEQLPPTQQAILRDVMRRQELRYRMIIAMLDSASAPCVAPLLDHRASQDTAPLAIPVRPKPLTATTLFV